MLLTVLLISKLLFMRWRIMRTGLGNKNEIGGLYTGLATMFLESAVMYSVISLIFIVLYGMQNTVVDIFIPLLSQIQVCVRYVLRRSLAELSAM